MAMVRELKQVDARKYLTVEEAAQALGLKTPVVRNYIYLGKLPAYKFKTLTLLSTDDVETWKRHQQER